MGNMCEGPNQEIISGGKNIDTIIINGHIKNSQSRALMAIL